MPTRTSFPSAHKQGSVGEEFVMAHLHELISSDLLLNLQNTSSLHVAGMDSTSQTIRLGETIESTLPDWVQDDLPKVSQGRLITSWIIGANEIKTVNNFLTRTDDNELPCGTLGFELWNDKERQQTGWLIHYLDPAKRNMAVETGQAQTKAVQPAILVYLLCGGDDVFAAVVFENVGELLDFLWAKAAQAGIDLNSLPVGENAQSFQPASLLIRENMWLIPLKDIAHFATITIIGDKPFMLLKRFTNGKCLCSDRSGLPIPIMLFHNEPERIHFLLSVTPEEIGKAWESIKDSPILQHRIAKEESEGKHQTGSVKDIAILYEVYKNWQCNNGWMLEP